MALEINWSEIALEDFERIYDYNASSGHIQKAERFRSRVLGLIELVAVFPKIGMKDPVNDAHRRMRLNDFFYIAYSIDEHTLMVEAIIPYQMNRGRFSDDDED